MAKSQIIKDLANGKVDTQTALKRTKVLLQDLENDDLLDWVNYEIEGYPDDVEIPDYRVIGGQLYGTYFKGSMANHITYNHVPLPLGNLPDEIKEDILTIKIRQGIEALKGVIAESEKNDNSGLMKPIPAEYYPYIAQANNDLGMIIATASVELNMPKVLNIFPKVESKLLDILSYLEKQFGNLDDLDIDIESKSEKELNNIINHIHVLIYNDKSVTLGDNNKIKNSNTTAFSISTMFYSISSGYPFFMIAFLQIVTFAGIYFKLGDLMAMFSLQSSDTQQVSRRIMRRPYMFLNRRARRLERKIGRTVAASAVGGVAGAAAASASTKKADNKKSAGSGHTRPNNMPSSNSGGNGKPPALPTNQKPLALPDKQNSDSSQSTVHSSSVSQSQETKSASKRGIVDKKAVSKQPQSEKQDKQRPIVDKTQKKRETRDKERQDNRSATKAGTAKGTAPLHERPVTTPVSAKAAPQAAGSKEEQNIKERPTTVKREQSQSARAKEPVTKQQEVRTQVARESSSPAATPKHSGTVTDMPRQTVKHQKQTKTVQKKTTNPSTMKKTTSRKGGKK